jgi:hypothetical protein
MTTIDYDEAYVSSEIEHAKRVAKQIIVKFLEADYVYDKKDSTNVLGAMKFLDEELIAWAKTPVSQPGASHDH